MGITLPEDNDEENVQEVSGENQTKRAVLFVISLILLLISLKLFSRQFGSVEAPPVVSATLSATATEVIPTGAAQSCGIPSETEIPVLIATATNTQPIPSETPTVTQPVQSPTPTFTPFPTYDEKKVVFSYYNLGWHYYFESYFDSPDPYIAYYIVIYSDGQILLYDGGWMQKTLSQKEINALYEKLDALGFYDIESNQHHNTTDALYDFKGQYERVYDLTEKCIHTEIIRSRDLCITEDNFKYVIPKGQKIFQYLDNYFPSGLEPYIPDRIIVDVRTDYFPDSETPETYVLPADFPSLESIDFYQGGEQAEEFYKLFKDLPGPYYIQNGKTYFVLWQMVLPDEILHQRDW